MASSGKITAQELDPNVFGDTNNKLTSIETKVDTANGKLDTLNQKVSTTKKGIAIFDTPGTYNWVCPEGVSAVKLTMFGGGGGGEAVYMRNDGGTWTGYGGNGASFVNGKFLTVTPGTTYQLVVGAGGLGGVFDGNIGRGSTGGPSSAFGLICHGGAGGGNFPATVQPSSNSPLVTRGAASVYRGLTDTTIDTIGPVLGRHGRNYNNAGGGAPGYGDGGDAVIGYTSVTHTTAGIGAGGGALAIQVGGSASLRACPGGNGIIIIEW